MSLEHGVLHISLAILASSSALSGAALAATAIGVDTPVPGLHAPASVTVDTNGISHIQAQNEHDLSLMQGWVHAGDRMFRMDFNRRLARGTAAELVGPAALENDVLLRTFGLGRAAEASWDIQSSRVRAVLEAYAQGVNAWIAANPPPFEYGALELTQIAPWQPTDCLAVVKLISFGLSFELDVEQTVTLLTYIQAGEVLGFDGQALYFEDLYRFQPFYPTTTLPPGPAPASTGSSVGPFAVPPIDLELARRLLARVERAPEIARLHPDRLAGRGSNEWVISGAHTVTGRPMIAGDQHLALDAPSVFYPVSLRGGGFDVAGDSFAGIPLVVLGHNRHLAWSATNHWTDVSDVFQEHVVPDANSPSGLSTVHGSGLEPLIPVPESYSVNLLDGIADDVVPYSDPSIPPYTLLSPRRNMGPVIELDLAKGAAITLQFSVLSATREIEAFYGFNRARNLQQFRSALKFYDAAAQHFAVITTQGDIAWFTSGETPLREDLEAGFIAGLPPCFIRNGVSGNDWLPAQNFYPGQALPNEVLPADEMPKWINPAPGWIQACNNDPTGDVNDNDPFNRLRGTGGIYYQTWLWDDAERGWRVSKLIEGKLAAGEKFSPDDLRALQADTVIGPAQILVPHLLQAFANAGAPGADPALTALLADPRLPSAVGYLGAWDFTTPTGIPEGYDANDVNGELGTPSPSEIQNSIAATLFSVWIGRTVENILDAPMDAYGLPRVWEFKALAALRNLLDNFAANQGVGASGIDFFQVPGVSDAAARRDILLLKSLADALDLLASPSFDAAFHGSTNLDDYRWGILHRVELQHPLDDPLLNVPSAGGLFPPPLDGLDGIPTDGGAYTIDPGYHDLRALDADAFMYFSGAVRRFVAQAGADILVRARSSLPGGSSGSVFSPFYINLLPQWLTNETYPVLLLPGEIAQNALYATTFVPGR